MGSTMRFGVSMDSDLLRAFDEYCSGRGYAARSEAIRDLIRDALIDNAASHDATETAGTLTLVYDHHRPELAQRLTEAQHSVRHIVIVATLHVHLDHDTCLEVIALRGPSRALNDFANQLLAVKGVRHGRLFLTAAGGACC